MSFTPRTYDEITRDLLTTLTGGTVRESVIAPSGPGPILLAKLKNRPIRRVSFLEGTTQTGVGPSARQVPYRFTAADFELVATDGTDTNKDAIRFRDGGRLPMPGTTLTVNYYPVQTGPVPLTDLNVGSVVRTLLETVAVEMALAYQQLDFVYKSGFVSTAQGDALDQVVALIGVSRLAAGFPVVKVQFSRATGAAGKITVPAGVAVTDDAGNRYLTTEEVSLEPGETSREVLAQGESAGTKLVDQAKLNRLEILVAGISAVTNIQPARSLSEPETDDQLRRRAKSALHGTVRGTLDALAFALTSMPEVSHVGVTEFPNGVPGEVRLDIAYGTDTADARARVQQTIDDFRPAGIRVFTGDAAKLRVQVRVELTLAGAGVPGDQLARLQSDVEQRIADYLSHIEPGGAVRKSRLAALALQDTRIADARIVLVPDGAAEAEDLQLSAGQVLDVARPFTFPTPSTEKAPPPQPPAKVTATIPVHLVAGVAGTEATNAIRLAVKSHFTTRNSAAPLNVDGLIAAVRDDTRYAVVRKDVLVTVEGGGRFLQLTDGIGAYTPAVGEAITAGDISVDVREGGV